MRWMILAVALAWPIAPLHGQTGSGPEDGVRTTVRAFHAALHAGDSTAAIARLDRDVVIFESGHAETLEQYRGGHLPADIRFARATSREVTDETVTVWGDVALYEAESHTTGRWRDREIDSHGAETMLLIRTADGWRIRHIHWSSR